MKKRRARLSTLVIDGTEYKFSAPGFKKASRGEDKPLDLYWQAADDAIDAGYPTKTVPLQIDLSEPTSAIEQIQKRCSELQAEMLTWLDGDRDDRARLQFKFDGTVGSLVDCFISDPYSGFADIQENSRQGYMPWLRMIKNTVGARLVSRLVAKDFRRWYRNWREHAAKGGNEGVRTAYGGIQGVRMLLNYGIESGIKYCRLLRSDMDKIRFPRGAPREETLSYAEAKAFVLEALKRGEKSMALSQALQFETYLRQIDVIGKWTKSPTDYIAQTGEVAMRGKVWRGLTMDAISLGEDLKIRTSKTSQPVVHRLNSCELVVLTLRSFSAEEWVGPVARRRDLSPFPDRQSYAKAWRPIATAAGLRPEVQNRDSRASGISEAREAGVPTDDLRRQAGHASGQMIATTYDRLGGEASERANAARQKLRKRKIKRDPQSARGDSAQEDIHVANLSSGDTASSA